MGHCEQKRYEYDSNNKRLSKSMLREIAKEVVVVTAYKDASGSIVAVVVMQRKNKASKHRSFDNKYEFDNSGGIQKKSNG